MQSFSLPRSLSLSLWWLAPTLRHTHVPLTHKWMDKYAQQIAVRTSCLSGPCDGLPPCGHSRLIERTMEDEDKCAAESVCCPLCCMPPRPTTHITTNQPAGQIHKTVGQCTYSLIHSLTHGNISLPTSLCVGACAV
mmetsp:Transcript_22341/g.63825  ORF Transcript_22341/g.63825 Transcript_22341/m.63825 type:complete len:136 (+) Transcript_22341:191-598(+)